MSTTSNEPGVSSYAQAPTHDWRLRRHLRLPRAGTEGRDMRKREGETR
jgi:hypothetical protein